MSHFRFLILSFLFVTFMGPSEVFASMKGHHHGGHEHALVSPYHGGHEQSLVSPFDKKQEGKSAHCLLNNHQHKGGFCPHSVQPARYDTTHRFSVDCGGKTDGATPSHSFHKDNIDNSSCIAGLSNFSFKLVDGFFSTIQQDLNSQAPPPEVL